MAVCAQEHALSRLDSHPADPSRHAFVAEVESFLGWISVVELKSRRMLIEPTDPAFPSSLLDKLTLDTATAL